MLEKFKEWGWGALGILIFLGFSLVTVALVVGGTWLTETYYNVFQIINGVVTAVILILIVLSVFPRFRAFTGSGIVIGTWIWGALFWLFCLTVTYEFWGFLGIFVGVIFFGVGVFVTALLALLFDGQISSALFLLLNLAVIFAIRYLGAWITTKHRTKHEVIDVDSADNLPILHKEIIHQERNELYEAVTRFAMGQDTISASMICHQFHISFVRSIRLIEMLEEDGVIGGGELSDERKVLVSENKNY